MRQTTKKSTGGQYIEIAGGSITETATGNIEIWAKNITTTAGGSINMHGAQNGIVFGNYVPRDEVYTKHPKVEKVEFLDENGKILNQNTKDFLYGKKLKIKVYTVDTEIYDVVSIELQGKSKSKNQKFDLMDTRKYHWSMLPLKENKTAETPLFELNPNWYSDDLEYYDYDSHTTKIKEDDLNEFFAEVSLNAQDVYLPLAGQRLKPVAYKRNYEELVGIFMTNNAGTKDLLDNYENKFIDSIKDFKEIVDDFSEYMHEDNHDLSLDEIRGKVSATATKLWKEAVWQNQGYTLTNKQTDSVTAEVKETKKEVAAILDDRPLYWARILMQVILKRHPIFEKDIDFEKSNVKKGTELEKTIQVFEEKSRNYNGIDFSGAGGKKKLLISGYDPFILNFEKSGNPLQSNPSGVNALVLHGKTIGNYYIQTFIYPVRYKDFDDFKNGKGVIETFFQPFIGQADMIITVSQGSPFRFDVDRFPCKNRGGYMDNMYRGDAKQNFDGDGFKQIEKGEEFYETTLPYNKMVPDSNSSSDIFEIYFNQTFIAEGENYNNINVSGTILVGNLSEIQPLKSIEGSGSNYLSNEIFYRVAKMRNEQRPSLQSGHFHIPLIQSKTAFTVRGYTTTLDINPKIKELIEAIKLTISKI